MDFQNVFDHSPHFSKNILKTCRFLLSFLTLITPKFVLIPIYAVRCLSLTPIL